MALVSYPAQPPKEIVSKLNAAAVEALVDPAVRSRLMLSLRRLHKRMEKHDE
jgi:hypothetical protein